jgi:hypothetical protein
MKNMKKLVKIKKIKKEKNKIFFNNIINIIFKIKLYIIKNYFQLINLIQ